MTKKVETPNEKKETKAIDPKSEAKVEAPTGGKETMTEKKETKVNPKPTTETKVEAPNEKKKETKPATEVEAATGEKKMRDLKPIKLTQKEFDMLTPEGLRAKMYGEPQQRVSRERGKEFLVDRVATGKVNSITPEAIMNWTYSSVQVKGTASTDPGFTEAHAKKTLTKKEFEALDAPGKANLIKEFTHKRRATDVIIPDLVTAGMSLSAEDVVYLTCGRIEIEGIVVKKISKPVHAVTEGVQFA